MTPRALAVLALLAAPAAAQAPSRVPALPPSMISAARPPLAFSWDPAASAPEAGHQPVCERKPVIAQARLPDPRAYFSSPLAFQSEGMTVHVAGSKDRYQKYGFFLAFTVDGGDAPVWVKMGLGKRQFQLRGRPYSIETRLSLLHHERIELVVRREADGQEVSRFTVGGLVERVQSAGPELSLLGRTYHATYVEDIREAGGRASTLSQEHTVMLTTYETYSYDNGKTGYKFQQIALLAEQLRGASIQPRPMGAKARGARGDVPVIYGFHVTSRDVLQVYDLTDYSGDGAPACAPLD